MFQSGPCDFMGSQVKMNFTTTKKRLNKYLIFDSGHVPILTFIMMVLVNGSVSIFIVLSHLAIAWNGTGRA